MAPKIAPKMVLRPGAQLRLILAALLFLAAPLSALVFGWPSQWSYLLLALSLGFYGQVRQGASIWLAVVFLAVSGGLSAGDYQGGLLTILPLLAAAALFLPKGRIYQQMFTDSEPQELAVGAIIEVDGQLQLVTAVEPAPEGLAMFTEQPRMVPEPLRLDGHCYLLAANPDQRRQFLRRLPGRSLLSVGALGALSRQWGLALGASLLTAIILLSVTTNLLLLMTIIGAPLLLALINTIRIYVHLRGLVADERQRLKISTSGQIDFSALQQIIAPEDGRADQFLSPPEVSPDQQAG